MQGLLDYFVKDLQRIFTLSSITPGLYVHLLIQDCLLNMSVEYLNLTRSDK